MNVEHSPGLSRDLRQTRSVQLRRRIARKIEELEAVSNITEVTNVVRMMGWEHHYRIRIGDYRLGVSVEGDVVTLLRFAHRSEIYRYFP